MFLDLVYLYIIQRGYRVVFQKKFNAVYWISFMVIFTAFGVSSEQLTEVQISERKNSYSDPTESQIKDCTKDVRKATFSWPMPSLEELQCARAPLDKFRLAYDKYLKKISEVYQQKTKNFSSINSRSDLTSQERKSLLDQVNLGLEQLEKNIENEYSAEMEVIHNDAHSEDMKRSIFEIEYRRLVERSGSQLVEKLTSIFSNKTTLKFFQKCYTEEIEIWERYFDVNEDKLPSLAASVFTYYFIFNEVPFKNLLSEFRKKYIPSKYALLSSLNTTQDTLNDLGYCLDKSLPDDLRVKLDEIGKNERLKLAQQIHDKENVGNFKNVTLVNNEYGEEPLGYFSYLLCGPIKQNCIYDQIAKNMGKNKLNCEKFNEQKSVFDMRNQLKRRDCFIQNYTESSLSMSHDLELINNFLSLSDFSWDPYLREELDKFAICLGYHGKLHDSMRSNILKMRFVDGYMNALATPGLLSNGCFQSVVRTSLAKLRNSLDVSGEFIARYYSRSGLVAVANSCKYKKACQLDLEKVISAKKSNFLSEKTMCKTSGVK